MQAAKLNGVRVKAAKQLDAGAYCRISEMGHEMSLPPQPVGQNHKADWKNRFQVLHWGQHCVWHRHYTKPCGDWSQGQIAVEGPSDCETLMNVWERSPPAIWKASWRNWWEGPGDLCHVQAWSLTCGKCQQLIWKILTKEMVACAGSWDCTEIWKCCIQKTLMDRLWYWGQSYTLACYIKYLHGPYDAFIYVAFALVYILQPHSGKQFSRGKHHHPCITAWQLSKRTRKNTTLQIAFIALHGFLFYTVCSAHSFQAWDAHFSQSRGRK